MQASIPVFPCDPASKHPLIRWRDPITAEALAAVWLKKPNAMPGLDCERAGLAVVDCDKKAGMDGEANFRSLCAPSSNGSVSRS